METPKAKEPVKIRFKALANGNTSIYLDIYYGGRRKYEFLQLYLIPEQTTKDREKNRQTLALANAIKSQRIVDLQARAYGFADKKVQLRLSFIVYMRSEADRYRTKGSKMYAQSVINSTHHLISYAGEKVTFRQVDKAFLLGYIGFLDKVKGRGGKMLSGASKALYFQVVVTALNRAVKEEIIEKNPAHTIAAEDRPGTVQRTREFLTLDEVKKLIDTPCKYEVVKRAFLFSCFCGLRLSDIQTLTWQNIRPVVDGRMLVRVIQRKTKEPVDIPLSANAIAQLPKIDKKEGRVFDLPMVWVIEKYLDEWAKAAGIDKHVTYHVSRHTHATMLLTYGADIYTVSKLLGHTRVQTTEIYAKIIDEKKQKAVDLIPDL